MGLPQLSCNNSDRRNLPRANIICFNHRNPISPWPDVEAAGLTKRPLEVPFDLPIDSPIEVEQHWSRFVQQTEDPHGPVSGDDVEIRHASPQQRMPLTKIVRKMPSLVILRSQSLARLIRWREETPLSFRFFERLSAPRASPSRTRRSGHQTQSPAPFNSYRLR